MPYGSESEDYYALLGVPHEATPDEIKRAYRLTLLRYHPDKSQRPFPPSPPNSDSTESNPDQDPSSPPPSTTIRLDAALLKEAYRTLIDPELRAEYDIILGNARLQYFHDWDYDEADDIARRRAANQAYQQSRPAHIVSLDDFEEANDIEEAWEYPCRCGDAFRITEAQMEEDFHLVSCPGCSEVIWVGYEIQEDEDEEAEDEEDENEDEEDVDSDDSDGEVIGFFE